MNKSLVKKAKKFSNGGSRLSSIKKFYSKIEKLEDSSQKAVALRYLGESFAEKDDTEKALSAFLKSANLAKQFRDYETIGICLFQIASIYSYSDDTNNAIKYISKSLNFLRKTHFSKLSFYIESCYYRLIPNLLVSNKPVVAEKYLAMAIKNSIFGAKYLSDMYRNFGFYYYRHADYMRSADFFKRTLTLSVSSNGNKADALTFLGRSLYYLSQFKKAKEYILAATPLLKNDKQTRADNAKFLQKIDNYLSGQ